MNFEPEPEEVLDAVIPKYINSVIYGGMMDAVASENGARMTAMDNATSNAEDMIENLTLSYIDQDRVRLHRKLPKSYPVQKRLNKQKGVIAAYGRA